MKSYRLLAIMLVVGFVLGLVATVVYLQYQAGVVATPSLAASPAGQATATGASGSQSSPVPSAPAVVGGAQVYSEDLVVGVYERVSPSVVNITNSRIRQSTLGEEEVPRGTGSGFIVDPRGWIVTNAHVVEGAQALDVTFAEGTTVSAKVLGTDRASDLALVQAEIPQNLLQSGQVTVAKLGDSDKLRPGQMAIAIGNPFGLERTITVGVISGLNREFPSEVAGRPVRGGIQTDAAINPGNSGGPLLNAAGEVIGVNSSIESPVGASVGVGFAVPINTVKRALDDMAAGRVVQHPRVGIQGLPVTQRLVEQLGLPVQKGVYVVQVVAGGPAEKAGIRGAVPPGRPVPDEPPKGGDVITAIDGQPVAKIANVAEYIELRKRVGDTVKLTLKRGTEDLTVDVVLDSWPVE